MKISCQFDSGSIEIVSIEGNDKAQLALRPDTHATFAQWFHFRVQHVQAIPCELQILDIDKSAYPEGWQGYRAMASYDRLHWFRVSTLLNDNALTIQHTPQHDSVYYAYFEPYSWERHLNLIGHAQTSARCSVEDLGPTLQQRDLNLVRFGQSEAERYVIWIIARQHPGETMAEWFVEGLLKRLHDPHDALANRLLDQATFYIVPNMNPDGSYLGNLRVNAAGANLNREWEAPSKERSPEVYTVRQRMRQTGVDLFIDVHGDESIPYAFIAGSEGTPDYTPTREGLEEQFKHRWEQANPDFQTKHGYPRDEPGSANMTLATHHIADYFDCLACTVEMPFKENPDRPEKTADWNGEKSRQLGASLLHPIDAVLPKLRSRRGTYS